MIIFETGWQCQTECENVRQSLWTVYCLTAAYPLGMLLPKLWPPPMPNAHANRIVLYSKPPLFFGIFSLKSQSYILLYISNAMTLSLSCDRFRNGQLEGLVTETLSFCERDNVSREVFYHRGVRHGFYRSLLSDPWV